MMRGSLFLLVMMLTVCGCGTTRSTDSSRSATEQQLITHAADLAISQLDFRILSGKDVFFQDKYIDSRTVDRGYLVSSIRQQILAAGCRLKSKEEEAEFIIEARCGSLGTDRHDLLIGVPEMTIPSLVPGVPPRIPEIPFAKKSDQQGVAKVGVFAYHRESGERVWQSGMVRAESTAKDLWLLGAGPIQHGSVRSRVTLAGAGLDVPFILTGPDGEKSPKEKPTDVTSAQAWLKEAHYKQQNLTPRISIEELARILPLGGTETAEPLMKPDPQKGSDGNVAQQKTPASHSE